MDYQSALWTVSELCIEYGISRPTAYNTYRPYKVLDNQSPEKVHVHSPKEY